MGGKESRPLCPWISASSRVTMSSACSLSFLSRSFTRSISMSAPAFLIGGCGIDLAEALPGEGRHGTAGIAQALRSLDQRQTALDYVRRNRFQPFCGISGRDCVGIQLRSFVRWPIFDPFGQRRQRRRFLALGAGLASALTPDSKAATASKPIVGRDRRTMSGPSRLQKKKRFKLFKPTVRAVKEIVPNKAIPKLKR